ncbi:MAG: hypothetical protein M3Z14_01415 [Candidatus Eremiobacteraeota bacterium]|nr:hypothetical protein [Candidatus Eremiobacteraeota bacterium]
MAPIQPVVALGVMAATAVTDAVYVMFTGAVSGRRRVAAATWSSVWYLLSSFAVISYTRNWIYVVFAALGSWIGAYASMTLLHKRPARSQSNVNPPFDAGRPS